MALEKSDFLRFSAYSFKDMITQKMSESTKFTDQVYEDSNLAILIDLCAYLFQGLVYSLNNAASESMFSDTQIYENISRLVKLIGYNPSGFIPSQATFSFTNETDNDELYIPQYTAIKTDLTDSNGNPVYYSFSETYEVVVGKNIVTLKNGIWKLYNTIFTANGSNYETFVLDNLKSDSDSDSPIVANGAIDVYVKRNGEFIKFKGLTDEIFMNTTEKYTVDSSSINVYKNTDEDRYYTIRLNENKTYEIKFGNDYNGQRLQANDQVYVFYLQTNGIDGKLTKVGEVNTTMLEPTSFIGLTRDTFYKQIIAANNESSVDDESISQIISFLGYTKLTNITASTDGIAEESVEDIRNTAPNYYKLGNRLITKDDFEYYITNKYKDSIIDVKCFNNWDYMSKFFGWLYKLGLTGILTDKDYKKHEASGSYYLTQQKLGKYDYLYADAADSNNVYLWIKTKNEVPTDQNKEIVNTLILNNLQSIKALTAELVVVYPIIVKFAICAAPQKQALEYLYDSSGVFDANNENYIEITISDNALYSSAAIKVQVNQIFLKFFNIYNMSLGQIVNFNTLEQSIYSISGVQRIRTVYSSPEGIDKDRYVDGISMATWSSTLIDIGDDLSIGANTRSLEDFQFASFYHNSIIDKIKVIKKSFSNNSSVQY